MKLSPMAIQGLWEYKSPLLQLPHITDDNLKYFQTKKRYVRSLQQLAKLPSDESRAMLKHLSDEEYSNVIKALARMPLIDFSIRCEVVDDEHTNIVTAGAIVTVYVNLVRRSMKELFGDTKAIEKQSIKADDQPQPEENGDGEVVVKENAVAEDGKDDAKSKENNKPKKPVWMKQKAHKGKSKAKSKGKSQLNAAQKTQTTATAATTTTAASTKDSNSTTKSNKVAKNDSDDSGPESDTENVIEKEEEKEDRSSDPDDDRKTSSVEDDDMEWEK